MSDGKVYDLEYKIPAVKLANEIGWAKAATELAIPRSVIYIYGLGEIDWGDLI